MNPWILYALLFALVGCALQVHDWWEARKKRMLDCHHRWTWHSYLNHKGRRWERHCIICPFREEVEPEQVPYDEIERRRPR